MKSVEQTKMQIDTERLANMSSTPVVAGQEYIFFIGSKMLSFIRFNF